MKLAFCTDCGRMFSLTMKRMWCDCGRVQGMYLDWRIAVVSRHTTSIAMGTGALRSAINRFELMPRNKDRELYQAACRIEPVWVRPNTGPGNPNTGKGPEPEMKLESFIKLNGGYWHGEHPDLTVKDWMAEVVRGDTRKGYWEWAYAREIGED